METITLGIKGMHCANCVKGVTEALQKIPGISSINVLLEQNQATIGYDPAKAQPAQFKAAIEDTGFDVV